MIQFDFNSISISSQSWIEIHFEDAEVKVKVESDPFLACILLFFENHDVKESIPPVKVKSRWDRFFVLECVKLMISYEFGFRDEILFLKNPWVYSVLKLWYRREVDGVGTHEGLCLWYSRLSSRIINGVWDLPEGIVAFSRDREQNRKTFHSGRGSVMSPRLFKVPIISPCYVTPPSPILQCLCPHNFRGHMLGSPHSIINLRPVAVEGRGERERGRKCWIFWFGFGHPVESHEMHLVNHYTGRILLTHRGRVGFDLNYRLCWNPVVEKGRSILLVGRATFGRSGGDLDAIGYFTYWMDGEKKSFFFCMTLFHLFESKKLSEEVGVVEAAAEVRIDFSSRMHFYLYINPTHEMRSWLLPVKFFVGGGGFSCRIRFCTWIKPNEFKLG